MADDLVKHRPSDTFANYYYVPTIRASIALNHDRGQEALEFLKSASAYELSRQNALYPIYVRGEAFLKSGDGPGAVSEFQKMLDHRGVVANFVTGALVHLQLGRAYAMMGDKAKAKAAYQDFLTLWKDADPDIPIYKQAKAEYAKLAVASSRSAQFSRAVQNNRGRSSCTQM